MLVVLFLSNQRFRRSSEGKIIATSTRLNECEEQVCSGHASSDHRPEFQFIFSDSTLAPPPRHGRPPRPKAELDAWS